METRAAGVRPHPDERLWRRVLTIEEFAYERRGGRKLTPQECLAKFGIRNAPIPVPLGAGETEEQYEAALLASLGNTQKPTSGDPTKERVRRCSFAWNRLEIYLAKQKSSKSSSLSSRPSGDVLPPRPAHKTDAFKTLEEDMTLESMRAAEKSVRLKTPREELYVKRYVDLDEYRKMVRNGLFADIKGMSVNQREREFGSQIVPIYVPLARGETIAHFEERFVKWLWEKESLTLEELVNHPNPAQERFLRLMFTKANARGEEFFVPTSSNSKRERDGELHREERPHKARKKEDTRAPVEPAAPKADATRRGACSGGSTVSSVIACGCRRCLVSGMRLLATNITNAEGKKRERRQLMNARAIRIEDLTSDTESTVSGSASPVHSGIQTHAAVVKNDPTLDMLMAAYDTINEQIVMNEKVLESSASRLAAAPLVNVKETTQIQDEDQEMRQLIRDEMKNRSEALAALIVYMWRHEIDGLMNMVNDPNATTVIHVQRACHHKCAQIAAEITVHRQALDQLQAPQEPPATHQLSQETVSLHASRASVLVQLAALQEQQKCEFIELIHFDHHIRLLIRGLLAKVQ